jgi:solute carrier family 35, member F5
VIEQWSVWETSKLAAVLCPLWFLMNYLFNLSLTLTSIASTTILSSTSGLFVVIISYFGLREKLVIANIVGVGCTISGAVLVSLRDYTENSNENESLRGDLICVASALFYASYTVYLNYKVPDDRAINIQLLFGLIGLINLSTLWPLFLIFHFSGFETYELPSATGKPCVRAIAVSRCCPRCWLLTTLSVCVQ